MGTFDTIVKSPGWRPFCRRHKVLKGSQLAERCEKGGKKCEKRKFNANIGSVM